MNWDKYKEQLKTSMISALIIGLLAHGYRFFNLINSHDSMLNIVQDDVYWQRSIGRFMQPVVMVLRGAICAPWLLGICSVIFFGLSIFMISIIFQIKDKVVIVCIAGIMISNIVITTSCAAYLPWIDVYAIALFLSIVGTWCCAKKSCMLNICGCVLIAISMGFYQAYVSVAVGVMMILSMDILAEEQEWKSAIKKISHFLLCLVSAGVIYFLLYQGVCKIHHVQLAETYNGLSAVGDFSNVSIWTLIVGAYQEFINFFRYQNVFSSIILLGVKVKDMWRILLLIVFIFICALIVVGVIRYNILKKNKLWKLLLQLCVILLFPLGVNSIYVISKGMEHVLMVYAFVLVYILAFVVVRKNIRLSSDCKLLKMQGILMIFSICLVVWSNIVYSNQLYYKLHLQQEATQSMMSKILYEIEHMEGYEHGVTPVAFVGSLNYSDYVTNPEYFNEISTMGVDKSPLTYESIVVSYVKYYLNSDICIVNVQPNSQEIKEMPEYPSKGSIAYVDEVLVVKISE